MEPVIKFINNSDKFKSTELVNSTSTVTQQGRIPFKLVYLQSLHTKRLVMLAINKTTAAKLIVLWNLPALLLLAGAYEVGTTVLA